MTGVNAMKRLTGLLIAIANNTLANSCQINLGKKRFSFALIPLILLTIALTAGSWEVPALALKKGDRGSEVSELQKKLQEKGYYTGEITKYYGNQTRSAVRKFQSDHNLRVDGIAGKKTLEALNLLTENVKEPAAKKAPTSSPAVPESEDIKAPAVDKSPLSEPRQNPAKTTQKITTKNNKTEAKKQPENAGTLRLIKTISGEISPKSIVYSGKNLFFAQNMMYRHTITVYDRKFNLVKTIPDKLNLSKYGFSKFKGDYQGSPVEASFSPDGKYGYISNYQMYGSGFKNPGSDRCSPAGKHDSSFLYRVNTESLKIDKVIPVGSVPKFTAVSPDSRFVLVSNWCTWDLSIVDAQKNQEIKRVKLGAYPRGIVVDSASKYAYIAVMGSSNIAKVNLTDFSVEWLKKIGRSPRHLNIDPADKYLYATLNGEGTVAKIDLKTGKVIDKVPTGRAPRSMAISDDGKFLYVVNYFSNTVSKVSTSNMKVLKTAKVNSSPIGITYDPQAKQVWVACYSGSIMVFQD